MEQILANLQWQTCLVYIDDVVCHGKDVPEMVARLAEIFQRFLEAGLKLKPRKCSLFKRQVLFLGHIIGENGIQTDPSKVQAVTEWPVPADIHDVRSFIGLTSYYRRFVKNYATIAKPLNKLMEKGQKFSWSSECQESFEALKTLLVSAPILGYPNEHDRFILDCDASGYGIGAVLSQVQNGEEVVIAYASNALSKVERNYCCTRRELLSIVRYVKQFRHFLSSRKFFVRTDHCGLTWLKRLKEPEGQLARWIATLSEFNYEVVYRPGGIHKNADAMSRGPCRWCEKLEGPCNETESPEVEDSKLFVNTVSATDFQWPTCEVRNAQKSEEGLGWMHRAKSEGPLRPEWREVSPLGSEIKAYWGEWDRIHLRNEVLYRRWESDDGAKVRWQMLLPRKYHESVFDQLHSAPTAGHLGYERVLEKCRQRFFWYRMRDEIRRRCERCDACARRKSPPHRFKAEMQKYGVGCPLQRIASDIMGPLPISHRGNRYILVVADYFTKFTEAYGIPDMETETVAIKIVEEFLCRYGVCLEFHSDRGSNYESKAFNTVCEMFGILKTRTTPYHPRSDGMVERFNRTLQAMLANLVAENQRDWDDHLPYVMMAYRSAKHESTGESPNYLMFGREVRLPLDLITGSEPPEPVKADRFVLELQDRLTSAYARVRANAQKAMARQKRLYDRHANPSTRFGVGSIVWYFRPRREKGKSPKFMKPWIGPYMIVAKLSDVTVRIQKSVRSCLLYTSPSPRD